MHHGCVIDWRLFAHNHWLDDSSSVVQDWCVINWGCNSLVVNGCCLMDNCLAINGSSFVNNCFVLDWGGFVHDCLTVDWRCLVNHRLVIDWSSVMNDSLVLDWGGLLNDCFMVDRSSLVHNSLMNYRDRCVIHRFLVNNVLSVMRFSVVASVCSDLGRSCNESMLRYCVALHG